MKGKNFLHRVIAHDVMSFDLEGRIVHHRDGDVNNNDPANLEVMTQAEHAGRHGRAGRGAEVARPSDPGRPRPERLRRKKSHNDLPLGV